MRVSLFYVMIFTSTMTREGGKISFVGSSKLSTISKSSTDLHIESSFECYQLESTGRYRSNTFYDIDDDDIELHFPSYDENSVWIRIFRTSRKHGIGGILTHWWRPSDFEVVELRSEDGRKVSSSKAVFKERNAFNASIPEKFVKFLLQKQGWDTLSALSAIAKSLVETGEHIAANQFG